MTYLSKDDILKADDLPTRDVDVPEWGGIVRVRAMSGSERDAYDASRMTKGPDGKYTLSFRDARANLVARCVIGDDGALLFNTADVARLGAKSSTALQRVADVAAELSGLADAADDLGKDSAAPPSDGSGSTSPND